MKIITDYKWKQFKYRNEVPTKILESDFDWATPEEDYFDGFFCYRGIWYHLAEFMRFDYGGSSKPEEFKNYDGYSSDSFFSGVLIKLSEDGEEYQVATYIS